MSEQGGARNRGESESEPLATIIARDRRVFDEWASDPAHRQNLNLSQEASRYLIPPRLYEKVKDSISLTVFQNFSSEHMLDIIVTERRADPVVSPQAFERLRDNLIEWRNEVPGDNFPNPAYLSDIPPKYFDYTDLIIDGLLGPYDHVAHELIFTAQEVDGRPESLYVVLGDEINAYQDERLRDTAIERVAQVAERLGFRFLVYDAEGKENLPPSRLPGFVRLSDVKKEYQEAFKPRSEFAPETTQTVHEDPAFYFVQFLHPEDAAYFAG